MGWYRFETKSGWEKRSSQELDSRGGESDYDFHSFCLEVMDVIWAWALAGGVVLVLLLLL